MAKQWTKQQAENYFTKLGIKCCDESAYVRWFVLAERCNTRCRTLNAFCNDCSKDYQTDMIAKGCCVNPDKKFDQEVTEN